MRIGIIQGRLSPPTEGFQDTPKEWQKEFDLLESCGLTHIEWVITKKSFNKNPFLFNDLSAYPISSVCADNMVDGNISSREFLQNNLAPICEAAIRSKVGIVTIPLLEDSSLESMSRRLRFISNMFDFHDQFPELKFSFEVELGANQVWDLVKVSDRFLVTYDTGNITSCKNDHREQIELLSDKINNVHLKDRTFDGNTVYPLSGNTDFKKIFNHLKNCKYDGIYTLQSARGVTGFEENTIKTYAKIYERIYNESE